MSTELNHMIFIVCCLIMSYLLGSIPTSVWLTKILKGPQADIRNFGSGNAGGTNAYRLLGIWPALLVAAIDILKGSLATQLPLAMEFINPSLQMACAFMAITGHIFPIYAQFRGGKGIATFVGAFATLYPAPLLIALSLFLAAILIGRMVGPASCFMLISFFVLFIIFKIKSNLPMGITEIALCMMSVLLPLYKHKENLRRFFAGKESKIF